MFISSRRVAYRAPRTDPIFPAPDRITVPRIPTIFPQAEMPSRGYKHFDCAYHTKSTEAAVLGCVDHTEICDAALDSCQELEPLPYAPDRGAYGRFMKEQAPVSEATLAYTLLALALSRSSICISLLAPRPLEAQSKIQGFVAVGLAEEQWKAEARRLFQASLAHIQIATLNIARDTIRTYNYYEIPPTY